MGRQSVPDLCRSIKSGLKDRSMCPMPSKGPPLTRVHKALLTHFSCRKGVRIILRMGSPPGRFRKSGLTVHFLAFLEHVKSYKTA